MKLLEATGLAIGYPRRRLFAGLDLVVPEGRLIVTLGPNGSGKSTLLRSLTGMQQPLAGSLRILGEPIARLDLRDRATRLAMVFTERIDSGWFSVFDMVAFGRYPHGDYRSELSSADREIIGDSLVEVGLKDFEHRLFAELSDGEKQKVLIARALAQATPLIVLDEPTAFLDAPARSEIFHLLRTQARAGKGILMSTHEVDLALREADEVWLIDRKRGLVRGSPEELVLSGAIGAAFDGPALAFDPASARFVSTITTPRFSIAVSGNDAVGLAWTVRLVERLDMSLEPGAEGYDASVKVEASDALAESGDALSPTHRWTVTFASDGSHCVLSSFPELEAKLRALGDAPQPNL